ncbi:MAG TPA: hypothetical protein VEJ18_14155 [Planctomycetota bacterium]|nr:hypothetical protein [Planctomycetota bacterium]
MLILIAALLPVQNGDVFPLKPGAAWEYRLSTGQPMAIRVVGASEAGGRACMIVETAVGEQKTREHLAVTDQGLTAFKVENPFGSLEYPTPILRAKLPFKEGDAWTVSLQEGLQLNRYEYRTGARESVRVPAGAYEAWKVVATLKTPQGEASMTAWYAPGVGLVKQVYAFGDRQMTAELSSTTLAAPAAAAPPAATGPRVCARCKTPDKGGGKFCAECAAPFPAAAAPATAAGEAVRYESKDGKVLLYHPPGWKVQEGDMFGPGTYSVTVEQADESAGVLFMTFAVDDRMPDSAALAGLVLSNLRNAFPDLAVGKMTSSRDRARTVSDVALTMQGRKVRGRFYFFRTPRAGTLYGLFAREETWEASRAVLARITANLAYAPEGVAQVLRQGREAAPAAAPAPEGRSLNPAWLVKESFARAKRGEGADVPLQPVTAQDGSFAMAIPRGWIFQGASLAAAVTSDERYARAYSNQVYTIFTPAGVAVPQPGMLVSPYLPPPQALVFLLQKAGLARDCRILSASTITELDPTWLQTVARPSLAAGAQVDNRILLVEFDNLRSGQATRGLFSITCTAWPLGTAWTCFVDATWAPAEEYDRWLPVYARMAESIRQNEGWVQGKFQAQAAESARLNRNLMTSINDLNRSYERYNQGWWESQRSRDYTSWAWSQTTLGQGSWVSEREGAQVVRSDTWGLENTRTGERTSAWNTTTFTGRDPWSGEQLDQVDTRAEYERYLR